MKLELERLKASGEFNLQQWQQQQDLHDKQAESARSKAIKDAETSVELAKLEAERQKALASVEKDAENDKMTRAMEMFEQVQHESRSYANEKRTRTTTFRATFESVSINHRCSRKDCSQLRRPNGSDGSLEATRRVTKGGRRWTKRCVQER